MPANIALACSSLASPPLPGAATASSSLIGAATASSSLVGTLLAPEAALESLQRLPTDHSGSRCSLAELPLFQTASLVQVQGLRPFRRRLMELGLTPGVTLRVVNVAPLGDPLELEVRGCRLSIRKAESQLLEVQPHRGLPAG